MCKDAETIGDAFPIHVVLGNIRKPTWTTQKEESKTVLFYGSLSVSAFWLLPWLPLLSHFWLWSFSWETRMNTMAQIFNPGIPAIGQADEYLWIQGHPDLYSEFQCSQYYIVILYQRYTHTHNKNMHAHTYIHSWKHTHAHMYTQ